MPVDEKTTEGTDGPFELENQFIMRLPPVAAASLRTVVGSGVMSLKDRLSIQLETDMRHGIVRFDGWTLPFKIVDLPTIIESLKTLDGKTFYKTADICQMMICKEEVEEEKNEFEIDGRKRDDKKDKKFAWPHGVTPPLKNVRKKRFRKTLKKKLIDAPEIEKEVKRLFRMDNEAIHVRFEVVNADEDKIDSKISNQASPGTSGLANNNSQSMDIVEHDLFGEVLSSSDEEDTRVHFSDEGSRLSPATIRDSSSQKDSVMSESRYVTEFTPGLLETDDTLRNNNANMNYDISAESSNAAAAAVAALEEATASSSISDRNNSMLNKLHELGEEIEKLQSRREAQELEIATIENLALKQRFQSVINNLKEQETEKRRQYEEILLMLNQ
ncbi:transcription initiation factor TFIID subunit 7-like isoform X2 [Leptotrombidium deliense]|uniref:Transcription initiation factor TFIID subunit 7-like isoform X2 n=1 Tax=Leptotrombidium deliense TaxID=299467 RepID=A0A443S0P5_9ACAR|nr:transcription initiation factor TFIID subunit 7-like isoform X2 [Leptotrombidium deliense]